MNETYDSSTLDADRLREYAREVARRVSLRHPTPTPAIVRTTSGVAHVGWDLGHVVEEGIRDGKIDFERGVLFFLRVDGELLCGEYVVNPQVGGDPEDLSGTADLTLDSMPDGSMTHLDRPNVDAEWRTVSTSREGRVREELGTRYEVRVEAKGKALTDALADLDRNPRPPRRTGDTRRRAEDARPAAERAARRHALPGELGEAARYAVPAALLAPLVYALLLGTWSVEFARVLDWNNPAPEVSDTPGDVFVLQAVLVSVMLVCLAILGYLLPYPQGSVVLSVPAVWGTAAGVALFLWQVFAGAGGMGTWFWPPLCTVLGHLAYGIRLRART
ncbi:hypothetical protein ACWEKT_25435 [Nocardia takedensis]